MFQRSNEWRDYIVFSKIIGILALIFVFTIGYAILRRLLDLLVEHKVRLRVLEEMDRTAGQRPVQDEAVTEVLTRVTASASTRQDYRVTGLLLGLLGIFSAFWGRTLGTGTLAVGLFIGGEILVGLGFVMSLLALAYHAYHNRRLPQNPR